MRIPQYVKELMERSRYEYDFCRSHENYSVGYTIKVRKHSAYAHVDTLRKECERLIKWANKAGGDGTAYILDIPAETHHVNQAAIVTIFDPVMQYIENYIPSY